MNIDITNPTHGIYTIHRKFQIQAFHSATEPHWDSEFVFSGELHDYWEVMYVVEGDVEVTQDDKIYRLSSGSMILHRPMKFHSVRSVAGFAPHVLITTFSVDQHLPMKLGEGFFVLPQNMQETYRKLFYRIYHFVRGDSGTRYAGQECADSLSAFLIYLINHYDVRDEEIESRDALLYRRLVGIMNGELNSNVTMEEVAKRIPVSASYMKVLFHRYAGMPPKQYYSGLRLKEAVRLMRSGFSAAETAEKMNFSSQNYFSNFFKKMTGQPPSQYMKKYGGTRQ